ncbi:MAG TPA: DegT/DnrJ/EryC1/StrS family aminotransferase [Solirubrobacterales bacterium]|nr:DegT/DnrJ/EryC1/StrS family aminotransferase [Solirubrobacterales bacterium]
MSDRPAILNGTSVRAGKSWPRWPQWDESERARLDEVLTSGAWSNSRGEQARLWAAEFAASQGARHGLPLTNGTHTLEAALVACGIGEGDEVIVPALTFVATATAALALNAVPVLVDVEADSLCIDVAAAAAAITERTRAVMAVHLGGRPCDLDALVDLCAKHDLALIEDCAHAHGSRWAGRGVGTFGSFGSFSLEAGKLITAGEGGALITDDEALRDRAWECVDCGRAPGRRGHQHATAGSNLRMTEWQGGVLRAQMERFPQQHRRRVEHARLLDEALAGIPGLRPQSGDPRIDSRAYYVYILHYDPAEFAGLPLPGFEAALAAEGVELGLCYPSLNRLELFRQAHFSPRHRATAPTVDYSAQRLPRAEAAASDTLWLYHPMLLAEPEDVLDIARAIERIQRHAGEVAKRTRRGGPAQAGRRVAGRLRRRLGGAP